MMKDHSKTMCRNRVSVKQTSDVCLLQIVANFCSKGTLVRIKKTWRYSARKNMEFDLLMTDIPLYVSCKFEMYVFKIALVIIENVRIAFLYVLSIYHAFLGLSVHLFSRFSNCRC